ncbi:transcription termination/antitermination protein NusA [Candidatus Saccharibacteria bacterium]|nr:transcription termination/antitermination protein NusA [Candidatus Saccharibacteria bacterium]
MQNQFISAIEQICEEKGISKETVLETIEMALIAAYKKDFGDKDQEVRVEVNPDSGDARIFITKEIVKEVENPFLEISVSDAQVIRSSAKVGETVEIEDINKDFGRVAAQTAKQVIIQRIREAEREVVYNEYQDKEETVMNGSVQRVEHGNVFIDLGRTTAIMFPSEQIHGERYYPGQRLKVYVVRVENTLKGPQIVVSRSHPNLIKALFEMEVPEISTGNVEIVGVAREAGARTKIAVKSNVEGVDPVGTFVGGRGSRVQAVMGNIGEEKIDIIPYDDNIERFIANALSPAKNIISVEANKEERRALVKVPEDQLSLAIGRSGQNVRLAAKLTDWNIDIDGADESGVEETADVIAEDKPKKRIDLEDEIIQAAEQNVQGDEAAVDTAKTDETEEKPEVASE